MFKIPTINKFINSSSKTGRLGGLLYLLLIIWTLLVSTVALAQGYSRGYQTDDAGLRPGMVVAINTTNTHDEPFVERATRELVDRAIGVTTNVEDNLVTLASGEQSVYVQTTGTANVFVTDVNGVVAEGDQLTISPLKGVLMRGNDADPVVARALEDFPSDPAKLEPVSLDNDQITAGMASMSVSLDSALVANQPLQPSPSALQRLGRSIVGRDVGELQVIVALIIFFIVLVSEGSIIYGAVSSGIISIGRNPLAKGAIKHELIRIFALALIVLLIGLGAIYLILTV